MQSRPCQSSPYVGGSSFRSVAELSKEVEGEVLAAHHEAPAALFLKWLHVWLDP